MKLRNIFRRAKSGKEIAMATEVDKATEAGGVSEERVKALLGESLKPLIDAQAAITESVGKLLTKQAATAAEAGGTQSTADTAKPDTLTADSVKQLIGDAFKTYAQTQQSYSQRQAFVAQNLGKLPQAYQAQLGQDPARWADESKAIHAQYEADFKGAGGKTTDLGGANRDGGTTAANGGVDLSKLTPMQKISIGVKQLPPESSAGGTGQTTATQAA